VAQFKAVFIEFTKIIAGIPPDPCVAPPGRREFLRPDCDIPNHEDQQKPLR
jgi:hypothetical protein